MAAEQIRHDQQIVVTAGADLETYLAPGANALLKFRKPT
jgi:hypothetical protein